MSRIGWTKDEYLARIAEVEDEIELRIADDYASGLDEWLCELSELKAEMKDLEDGQAHSGGEG